MLDTDEVQMKPFTAFDRCDRCGAQAYAVAAKKSLEDLLFCIHHVKSYSNNLRNTGWTITFDCESMDALVPQYGTPYE